MSLKFSNLRLLKSRPSVLDQQPSCDFSENQPFMVSLLFNDPGI